MVSPKVPDTPQSSKGMVIPEPEALGFYGGFDTPEFQPQLYHKCKNIITWPAGRGNESPSCHLLAIYLKVNYDSGGVQEAGKSLDSAGILFLLKTLTSDPIEWILAVERTLF